MKRIKCNLTNCFGIGKLEYEFDFTDKNIYAIYARNGLMKTSFLKTFWKISDNKAKEIKDIIFDKDGKADIFVDGQPIDRTAIFTIRHFENKYVSENIWKLLVNNNIKEKIDSLLQKKNDFFKKIEELSGLKIFKKTVDKKFFELEDQLLKDLDLSDSFINSINRIDLSNILENVNFSNIKYEDIFNDTVIKKIQKKEIQKAIKEYCEDKDEIYKEYKFLQKTKLSFENFQKISGYLEDNYFFINDNFITLNGEIEIKSIEELRLKIDEIKQKVKNKESFKNVEKELKTQKQTNLLNIIENNLSILDYLHKDKHNELRKIMWLSYFKKYENEFNELKSNCLALSKLLDDENNFDVQKTKWRKVIDIFKQRFIVPYDIEITNLKSSILGESLPKIKFTFLDESIPGQIQRKELEREELESNDTLSQGEKRALYLLNIIFDIETLKEESKQFLIVIDDIADSFDYKNKYAIIEYLNDISENQNFKLIILSHNFDFYRSICSRLGLKRRNKLNASRIGEEIKLKEEKYQKDPLSYFLKNIKEDKYLIASIPLIRQLSNYLISDREKNIYETNYEKLTNFIHRKKITPSLRISDIKDIFDLFIPEKTIRDKSKDERNFLDVLYSLVNHIDLNNAELEDKIIFSMLIRFKVEEYMIKKILESNIYNEDQLYNCKNQTREWSKVFKQIFKEPEYEKQNNIITKTLISVPEFIHINSFMYEPLIDMDIYELHNLYEEIIKVLK
ncbi:hypothetical protein [Mycoplasma capricolum]|uniref:hypothetical protein n=1 Tax=Mycoplasma capricolum TaxID=2095 RepID=UPI0034DAE263